MVTATIEKSGIRFRFNDGPDDFLYTFGDADPIVRLSKLLNVNTGEVEVVSEKSYRAK